MFSKEILFSMYGEVKMVTIVLLLLFTLNVQGNSSPEYTPTLPVKSNKTEDNKYAGDTLEREDISSAFTLNNDYGRIKRDEVVFPIQPRVMYKKNNKGRRNKTKNQHNKRRKNNKRKKQNRRKKNKKKHPSINEANKHSNGYDSNRHPNTNSDTNQNNFQEGDYNTETNQDSPEYDFNNFEDYKDYTNYDSEDNSESQSKSDEEEPVHEEEDAIEYPDYGPIYNDRLPGPNTGLRLEETIAGKAFFAQGTAGFHGECQLQEKPGTFERRTGRCNHISQCVNWWKRNNTFLKSNCRDDQHSLHVCCVENTNKRDPDIRDFPAFTGVNVQSSVHVEVKVRDVEMAIDKGREELSRQNKGLAVERGMKTPEAMYATFTKPKDGIMQLGALEAMYTLTKLAKSKHLGRSEAGFGFSGFSLANTTLGVSCAPEQNIRCDVNYRYRSFDGSCNNLLKPHLGKANTAYARFLPPNYADGIYAPPSTVQGGVLPSPHRISNSVITEKLRKNDNFNGLHSTWWQFMSYDLAKTPTFRLENGSGIQCCKNGKFLAPEMRHPMCFPIQLSGKNVQGRSCMNFVRSIPASRPACDLGYTEQLNEATHFLDLSNVYGTSKAEADSLRTLKNGRLRSVDEKQCGCELLPEDKKQCIDRASAKHCFKTGDTRSNSSPLLTVLHTLFVRRHNNLAKRLYELNPFWDDERLYQETRRLVIAEYQKITYDEWLNYLGIVSPWKYKPYVKHMGKPVTYNPDLNPAIPTELPTAVLRAAQASIWDTLESRSLKPPHTTLYSTPVEDTLYNVTYLREDNELSHLLMAMTERREDHLRGSYNPGLHSRLFQTQDYPGFDLLALNIQRGRDHGLRPWNDYRELCGFKRYKDWDKLQIQASHKVKTALKSVYKSVDDVDLMTGLLIEKQEETFTCLLLNGIRRLRESDRFYFKNTGHPGSFTKEQIAELDKSTSARFVCSVSGLQKVAKVAFFYPSSRFKKNKCSSYGDINLEPWRDIVVQTWHGRK